MFKAIFEVHEENNCPLYNVSERFELSDKVLTVPENKQVCLILVREITQILFTLLGSGVDQDSEKIYSCSGCTGLMKFRQVVSEEQINDSKLRVQKKIDTLMIEKFGQQLQCELFNVIPIAQLPKFFAKCQKRTFNKDHLLIRQGEISEEVYIILRGGVIIEDGPVRISYLGEGEIIGEMSYLAGTVASNSVRCSQDTDVLAISGREFSKLLERSSRVQLFTAQLLAKRLSFANRARAEAFESCMSGRINEMAPAELFQVFHMHSKTGVLSLELPQGDGSVSFREGCIINAHYNELDNEAAIFAILAEREGVYKFTAGLSPQEMRAAEIGDFMGLLMEGVKRIDEASLM